MHCFLSVLVVKWANTITIYQNGINQIKINYFSNKYINGILQKLELFLSILTYYELISFTEVQNIDLKFNALL